MKRFAMMVLIAAGLAALVLALGGCKSTLLEQELPSGVKIRARDSRFLVNTQAGLNVAVDPTNGIMTITVDVKSGPDAALIEAAVRAAIESTAKAVVPVP